MKDDKYDSDFFQSVPNQKLEKIVNSIKMLNTMVYYQIYLFNHSSGLTLKNLGKNDLSTIAINKRFSTETASGTATIIYSEKGKIALLTCAHILNYPDSLFAFFKDANGLNTEFIESLSIKTRQTILLPELTISSKVDILALDAVADIALVGKDISSLNASKFIPIDIPFGNSDDLSWGTKVYIIGYPLNNKMITTGIVSPSQIEGKDYFFVDAVFNRGFSGGIVMAIRDGAPNFELVGMIKSGTVHRSFNLVPDYNNPEFKYRPQIPYKGDLIVEEKTEIKYGVTKIMSVKKIIDFLDKNKSYLNDLGYDLKYSF